MKEKSYTQVQLDKVTYTSSLDVSKEHMRIHDARKSAYMLENLPLDRGS